ncbi:hypothetical protein CKM354_000878400 [Cercospora kikuchii]|uniref:Carrier domain-containing protein n=1 Tax=Cercospora kikuchii TaxID=84275 RepID=A0A9P3CN06_9PEZI|nr:uncharacterized protein CKM354_000878400 [Cercospora kikuchii]GIZ45626.1 hypothetical protein CKM354_000878400 [Cercospora kikuchii]
MNHVDADSRRADYAGDVQATDEELKTIWHWNSSSPRPIDGLVHDLMRERAQARPDAPAVHAWDGDLTYSQLDAAAGRLAHLLASRGVTEGDIVAIYLKKSKWTPIAMLGIIKSGATAVTLDASHPASRLENILEQTNARLILTSSDLRSGMPGLERCQGLELGTHILDSLETDYLHREVVPSRFVYISFTSGTTGRPKGACMSHINVRSAIHYQGRDLGFHNASRVLDFAPYSFDVAWSNFLHTICAGGCLCIAKEEDMMEDLAHVLSSYRCTLVNLTPTVLRTVQSNATTLETILLSGEPPYPENISQWAHRVRLLNTYGPAECTFKSTFSLVQSRATERPSIGAGVGSCTWLVDLADNSRLVSLGAVGEVYLEGPLVGQGYIANPELTAAAFVVDPTWLLRGCTSHPGRRGRLYKTGDLARYDADGKLIFVGRKDTSQVKIRGQRVEMADVEHHARSSLPLGYSALVDVVRPTDTDSLCLTLFIELAGHAMAESKSIVIELSRELANCLPGFMIPTLYYPVDQFPRAATGKADRRALRDKASAMTMAQLLQRQATILDRSAYVEPQNNIEQTLRNIWAEVLHIPVTTISTLDNFLRLGGDSIRAIRMISAARDQHLSMSISNVFHAATLRDLAMTVLSTDQKGLLPSIEPFSLLSPTSDRESIRRAAAASLDVGAQDIEDIFPCTPMQQGMIAMTSVNEDSYIWSCSYKLPLAIDLEALELAWTKVVMAVPVLRTRILHAESGDLVQVVVRYDRSAKVWDENVEGLSSMGLGTPLFKLGIRRDERGHVLYVQMHHAVFDGWSRSLIFRAVEDVYREPSGSPRLARFQPFVHFALEQIERPRTAKYWNKQLHDCQLVFFPPVNDMKGAKEDLHVTITNLQWPPTGITPSSMIRAALALLVAKYTNSDEVVFGATVSGRQACVPDIDLVAGPTFAVAPVRVNIDWEQTLRDLQIQMQEQMIEMHEYEQYGIQNIKNAVGASFASDLRLFNLLLVVQQDMDQRAGNDENSLFSATVGADLNETLAPFNSHGMMMVATPAESELALDISFDTASISRKECKRFVEQLEHLLHLLCTAEQQKCKLRNLLYASTSDIQQALAWSGVTMPLAYEPIVNLIGRRIEAQSSRLAIDAHDSKLTYRDLWCLSSQLAISLRKHDIQGCKIPLCLEKSSWMAVAMLAVLRAGATAVPVSSSIPADRARHIVRTCDSAVSITSRQMAMSCPFAGVHKILLVEDLLDEANEDEINLVEIQHTRSCPAIVVFTSGTTSSAKAVLWSHLTLSSNVQAAIEFFGLSADSRVLQFAAYDFDVSIVETVAALCAGGCVCVPRQSELSDRLSHAIEDAQASWICLTPSVASLLNPTRLPSLQTIVLAGESVTPTCARSWIDEGLKVIVWYGPAEASVATCGALGKHDWPSGFIGRSKYARTWVVDIRDSGKLAPIGTVGELCIEGPMVADGYINSNADVSVFSKPRAVGSITADRSDIWNSSYRTGDYVKFDEKGNLIFVGRGTDSWIKIHGRRVQLYDVEEAAQTFFAGRPDHRTVADVASFADTDSANLVLFVCSNGQRGDQHELSLDRTRDTHLFPLLQRHLASLLPEYMTPTYFIPVNTIPLARTGKVDRRRLHHFANKLRREELLDLADAGAINEQVLSHLEKLIAEIWAPVLGIDLIRIRRDDHFFRLGGDSVAAMRLVALADRRNVHISTAQVFQHPILCDMAAKATTSNHRTFEVVPPFSLLDTKDITTAVSAAARLCDVVHARVMNMYPCTALQQGLLALTARNPGQYVSRSVLQLQDGIDSLQFQRAWLDTVEDFCMLRTRIVDLPGAGLVQVVLKDLPMQQGSDVEKYLQADERQHMSLGDALCRAALIERSFVLTIHHSIYDGTFLSMLLRKLEAKYFSRAEHSTMPFETFVRHTLRVPVDDSKEFWRRKFATIECQPFPQLPPEIDEPRANRECARDIVVRWPREGSTPSIVIQSAWAVLAARLSMTDEVCFGTVLSGRQVDLPGIENCAGPTVCTVPIPASIDWRESITALQIRLRQQDLDAIPYQQYGIHNIAKSAGKSNPRDLFQTLLVVHPASTGKTLQSDNPIFQARSFGATLATLGTDPFNVHALMVSCWLVPDGMRLVVSFDNRVLTESQVQVLMHTFERILRDMCERPERNLGEVNAVSAEDVHLFWSQQSEAQADSRGKEYRHGKLTDIETVARMPHDPAATVKTRARQDGAVGESSTSQQPDRLREQAASLCDLDVDDIEDLYPCTPLQEILVALSERRPGDYVGNDTLQLAPSVDLLRFRDAWEAVVQAIPILRTRITHIPGEGLVQIVRRDAAPWSTASTLSEFARELQQSPISVGTSLARYGLVTDHDNSSWIFALTIHHAAYDGITNTLIREALGAFYDQQALPLLLPFRRFVNDTMSRDPDAERDFWSAQFEDLDVQHFPSFSHNEMPRPDSLLTQSVEGLTWGKGDILPSTIVRAAWALVCSRYSSSHDVVFGTIVSGRQAPLDGIDRVCGPTIAALPVRILAGPETEVGAFLQAVQSQALEMIPFEQTGIARISSISEYAREACDYRSMLVIQPEQNMQMAESTLFIARDSDHQSLDSYHRFNSHALMAICTLGKQRLSFQLSTDSGIIDEDTTSLLAGHFSQTVRELCKASASARLSELSMTTEQEVDQIWRWNEPIEMSADKCVHETISRVAQSTPNAIAISAWDGDLTYEQLDRLSTSMAQRILKLKITDNQIVPICFAKSMWTTVAFLGVAKAGHAVLILEPNWPETRLRNIMVQIKPELIITSSSDEPLCSKLCEQVLRVDSALESVSCHDLNDSPDLQLPSVKLQDTMYIIFTSGSTGEPKGCMISHGNMSNAVALQKSCHRIDGTSRVYDFSAYSFDAHHWCLIHTLCAGGTLCVPSEAEKQDRLLESLQSYRVTDLLVTPATARMIDPASVPTIRNAIIVGDKMHSEELTPWAARTNLTYAYGPSEATCWATSWKVPCPVPRSVMIGKGNGQVVWIVDPDNFDRLSPIGTVGELCLEGPLVGQGYFGNDGSTRASFVDSPSWLTRGCESAQGRHGRVYRTGDLVKYNQADGNIIFVGRRDNQVKLNGRRLELGEIEQHLVNGLARRTAPPLLAAEVVTPAALARSVLVVFVQVPESTWETWRGQLEELRSELGDHSPSYMIPSTFLPLSAMPLNSSGKINRRKLREIGRDLDVARFAASSSQSIRCPPATERERRLQHMWSQTLHISLDTIGRDSNYFRIGGDSISAMQLMTTARRQGFSLAVSQILTKPCLKDMADAMEHRKEGVQTPGIEPFSLLNHPGKRDEIRREISRQCSVSIDSVEDCYPCTAVQKSLLAVTSKRPGDYIARIPIQLADEVDLSRLQEAWEQVSSLAAPILRNRVVAIEDEGFIQAQLRLPLQWSEHESVESFLESDNHQSMGLGTSLTRLAIVRDAKASRILCILIQHHAIYDGVSIALLLEKVSSAYKRTVKYTTPAPFQRFIQHVLGISKEKSRDYWRKQFSGCKSTTYPDLLHEGHQPQANSTVSATIEDLTWPEQDVTPAVVVRAAWAILSGRYTDSEDVVFGVLSTGRHAPVDGIENMIAPLIAALPVRVLLEPSTTVHQLLSTMQSQSIEMTPYEQTDLSEIQSSSEDAASGAKFNALLVIQHSDQAAGLTLTNGPFEHISHSLHDSDLNHFNPHAAMIMFQLNRSGELRIEVNFDAKVIGPAQADLLLSHFERVLRQICASSPVDMVKDISALSARDVETLWKWNAEAPAATSACVHDLIASTASTYPDSQALCAWDGELTYHELDTLSNKLAKQLLHCGVTPGSVVPLCFEKSMWQPVAALGAMKAGAACVSIDCTQPEGRLRSIIARIEPEFILSSNANQAMADRLSTANVVVVGRDLREWQPLSDISIPKVSPHDMLYVVFTSGSTGVPKGVVTTHQNFASATTHQRKRLKVSHGTRVFDFVSYSFDVAWSNLLNTLICGGCLCIPSESDRKNDIAGAFNRLKANYSYFTPTVARSLNPLALPELRILAMGGEPIPATEISRWRQVESVVGIYGPAECAQALCFIDLTRESPSKHVGRSFGARTWLVEPGRVDRLAPIGAVGELVIEGPAVAMGYWKDEDTTNASFVACPAWLAERNGNASRVYKTGDLLRYNAEDGTLIFVGRKDQMVKLRGQRIELSEVEHHVQKLLRAHTALCKSVAAEIITPCNSKAPILAMFLALADQNVASHDRLDRTFRLTRALEEVEEDLVEVLPQYMIPGAYIVLDEMPMTTTDKIDRRTLRQIGGQRRLEDLASMQLHGGKSSQKAPSTDMERRIQQLWSQILGIEATSIKSQSSFLRIGGESISAMRLVAAARQAGISFTVADIFRNPRLGQLAQVAQEIQMEPEQKAVPFSPRKPFSLLPTSASSEHMEFLYDVVEPLLGGGVDVDDIQDVLPATDFQALAAREALQTPPGRLPHFLLDLPKDVDVARLRWACKRLTEHFDILRTVFIEMGGRVWHVQLSNLKMRFEVTKTENEDINATVQKVCERDLKRRKTWGEALVAFMVVTSPFKQPMFIFRMSHAQFDDHSCASMFQALTAFYLGESMPAPRTGFGDLISFREHNKTASLEYWRNRLHGASAQSRAEETNQDHAVLAPGVQLSFQISIPLPPTKACRGIPLATIFHAACAIVLEQQCESQDVVFGRLVTGRALLPAELQETVGPCLVEQPIRYRAQSGDDLWSVAQVLQRQFIEDASHEAAGMIDIIRQATSWPAECCDFGWRTAFQQRDDGLLPFLGQAGVRITAFERPHPPRCRPEIYATPGSDKLELSFEGNRVAHNEEEVRSVVEQVAKLLAACVA